MRERFTIKMLNEERGDFNFFFQNFQVNGIPVPKN